MRSPVRVALVGLVALLVGLLDVTGGARATPATAAAGAAPTAYSLQGAGYGHGVGLSQYGAQGAAGAGLSHRQILDFYYPGTAVGKASGSIRVLITAETRNRLIVAARPGLSVRSVSTGTSWTLSRAGARWWRITPSVDNTLSRVWVYTTKWQLVRAIRGEAEFVASSLTLRLPSGSAVYRGKLRSARVGAGRDAVNVVGLDNYLRGVVPLEMPALWRPAALRTQAVAARTYAVHERDTTHRGHFDVYDTIQSQVYGGVGAEAPTTNAAVAATRGEIRTHGGGPAFTQFSSSNGGWTVAGSRPYLVARADPHDPVRTWTDSVTAAEIRAAWPKAGAVQSVRVLRRDGRGPYGGRATVVRIVGSAATVDVTGSDFRSVLGLRTTLFRFT
jgi:SpoIID/LytB domain protein